MKNIFINYITRKLTFLILFFSITTNALAATISGITYSFPGGNEVAIINSSLTGDIVIPSTITYASKVYNVTSIKANAFYDNSLTSVVIPSSITYIGNYSFYGNSLTSISIPSTVNYIGSYAFYGNLLTSVVIPNSVSFIGESAFRHNNLSSITLSNALNNIGQYTFSDNLLTFVNIPDSVTSISDGAFMNNSLDSIEFSEFITSIGTSSFRNNSLKTLTIPDNVTSLGQLAFGDNSLTSLIVENETPIEISYNLNGYSVFGNYAEVSTINLLVPDGAVALYSSRHVWMDFKSITLDIASYRIEGLIISAENSQIVANQDDVKFVVFNLYGQAVNNENLLSGIYIVKVVNSKGRKDTLKVIVK